MRSKNITSSAGALLLLAATVVSAKHGVHEHLEALHKRHSSQRTHQDVHARSRIEFGDNGVEVRSIAPESVVVGASVEKRSGQCQFPTGEGLVPVTMGDENAGWAMSPNQPCTPGTYCPYACPPGQMSMQWDPSATSYSYPKSMNGGLYCDDNGNIQKPFPDEPYCKPTTANIGVTNNAGSVVAFCQTVLPGNEAMLIPTAVESWTQLAVPDMSYWCNTAAHYYINPPGISTDTACVWGTNANPWGNWAPYVAGGNTDATGKTFIKLGWNPIYLEQATPFRNTMPDWGVEIQCNGEGCGGLPCAIDPSKNSVNEMVGSASDGAGGGAFCVVTVPQGVSANFVITGPGGSSSSSSSSTTTTTSSVALSWNSNQGQAGQFYQSTSTESSTTSTTTTTSETTAWSTMSSYSNATSSHAPTHSPYYSLFNHTHTTPTTAAVATSAPASTFSATPLATTSLPKTGAASSSTQLSVFGFAVSMLVACLSISL